jgi:hypothetical protein
MAKHKKSGKFISFLLLVLIMVVVFNRGVIYHEIKSFIGFGDLQIYEVKTVDFAYDIDQGIIPQIELIDRYPISIVDATVTLFASDGEAKWQQTTDFEDVLVSGNSNFFVMADPSKGNIMVYDYRGNVNATLFGEGELSDLLISPEGYVIVLKSGSSELVVYDPKLNHISNLNVHADDVVEIKIGDDGLIYVGTLAIEGSEVNSYIYKYDVSGNLIGSIQMIDKILLEYYLENLEVVVLTDQDITIYNSEMEQLNSVNSIGEIDLSTYKDEQIIMQIFDRQSELSPVASDYDIISFDLTKNEVKYNKSLVSRFIEIIDNGRYLIGYNNNEMALLDSDGEIVQSFDLSREVVNIESLDQNLMVMRGIDYFTVFELKH